MAKPPNKPVADFSKQWDQVSKEFYSRLKAKLDSNINYRIAVEQTFKELGIQAKFKAYVLETVVQSFFAGMSVSASKVSQTKYAGQIPSVASARKTLLASTWPDSKLTLLSRISRANKDKLMPIIKETIRRQLNENNAISKLAKSLTDQKLITADLPKYLRKIEVQARRVGYGKVDQEFRKVINQTRLQIERLKKEEVLKSSIPKSKFSLPDDKAKFVYESSLKSGPTAASEKLKAAYQKLINQTDKLTKEGLNKAIDRAINAKARYNAERIARNEATKAFGNGFFEKLEQEDPKEVDGWYSTVSNAHTVEDICDELANIVYPIGEGPDYPYHINCVIGNSRVWWDKELQRITKASYCGDIIIITLKNRKKISVTPNHLIMTSNGWVAAKDLKKLDKVVTNRRSKDSFSINNHNYIPPKIKDLFKSFMFTSFEMPLSAKDFHGDGEFCKSKVDIVSVDSFLGNNIKSTFNNIIKLSFFFTFLHASNYFICSSVLKLILNRFLFTSKRIMSFFSTSLSKCWIKNMCNFLLFRFSSKKIPNSKTDMMSGDLKLFSERLLASSCQIELSDIINIKRRNFTKSIHVYDLQCDTIYFCNDVLVHNCRCNLHIAYKGQELPTV